MDEICATGVLGKMMKLNKIPNKAGIYLLLLGILIFGILSSCGSPPSPSVPTNEEPQNPPEAPLVVPVLNKPEGVPDRVDVIYFRRPTKCTACQCYEYRTSYVVKTYFQDELDNGKLTFKVLEIGKPENTEIINKYVAFGAQLFINIVKDEVDHIADIKEISDLDCIGDNKGFDNVIRDVIERSLSG